MTNTQDNSPHSDNTHAIRPVPDEKSRSELYDSLLEQSGDGVFVADSVGNYIEVNSAGCRMLGYTRDEIVRLNIANVIDPADIPRIAPEVARYEGGKMAVSTWKFVRKDGTTFNGLVRGKRLSDGKLQGVLVDISNRTQADSVIRESESKLRGLFELSPFGIVLVDMQGNYLEFNDAFLEICGYSEEELKTLDYWTLTPKKYEQDELRQLELLRATGQYGPYEKEYLRKDGSLIPLQLNGMFITGKDGRQYIWSIVQDITERKLAENILRESEERFRIMIQNAPEAIFLFDIEQNRLVDVNRNAEQLFQCDRSELLQRSPLEFIQRTESDTKPLAQSFQEHNSRTVNGEQLNFERVVRGAQGREALCEIRLTGLPAGGRKLVRASIVDISARRQSEREREAALELLAINQSKLKAIFESGPEPMIISDGSGMITMANRQVTRLLGYASEELIGSQVEMLMPSRYRQSHVALRQGYEISARARTMAPNREVMACHKDGHEIAVEISLSSIQNQSGRLIVSTLHDLTERKNTERVIRESEYRFHQLMENMSEGYTVIDSELRYVYQNKSAVAHSRSQPGQLIGKRIFQVHPQGENSDLVLLLQRVMASKVAETVETSFTYQNGSVAWFELHIAPVTEGVSVLSVETTQRRQIELELEQKRSFVTYLSRLAILGELSGAIAHELNQPLMSILMNAESAKVLLTRTDHSTEEVNEILTEIVDEDLRASGIIQRLRKLFAQQEVINLEVDINELVTEVGKILKNELVKRGMRLQLDLDAGVPTLNIDRIQIEQVLINLIMNACDAMETNGANQERTVICTTRKQQNGVKVSVIDGGSGIPAELLTKIFDPFFTTKKQGMGLGLSICRTIINAHSGALWAENNADAGSSFHLTLPLRAQS